VIPYHDENKTQTFALVTYAFIAVNVLAWLFIQGAGTSPALPASVCNFGLIAGELTGAVPPGTSIELGEGMLCVVEGGRNVLNIFTSMFMHGSWLHLIGKMWFLYLFGNNIEDSMDHLRFLVFYLVSGVAAALVQVFLTPASTLPMVGASGAISGVMGGYLVLYPRVRVFTFVPIGFFLMSVALPAWTMLIYWLVIQVLGGFTAIAGARSGGVAFWAHIGGFVAGAVLVKLFARPRMVAEHQAGAYRPSDYRRAA
jgi:membrane associated rhomboid family serine protease